MIIRGMAPPAATGRGAFTMMRALVRRGGKQIGHPHAGGLVLTVADPAGGCRRPGRKRQVSVRAMGAGRMARGLKTARRPAVPKLHRMPARTPLEG